ncbi:phosphatidylinositol-glycan biosynthesis class X protein [Brachionichthys hirsutus]|uniref:phosphatidylinositol-glycan biosynthesis class X protein n=1 Tax=Brachionichthys hirsutus TaxID=412623 RepID=UPI0036052F2C
MYSVLFCVVSCISICYCSFEKDKNSCGLLAEILETSSVSVEINKKGFHRDVVITIELSPDALSGFRVLLAQRWPRGVYIDPYQLASLSNQSDWQILLDAAIDLEEPAHKTSGFVTYVYFTHEGPTPSQLRVTIPIHGRYQKPSCDENAFALVEIEPLELLLWTESGMQCDAGGSLTVVDAPCNPDNLSTCAWVKLKYCKDRGPLGLQFPVGDGSLETPVCAGTLLVTMICCVALSKYIWEHRII